MKPAICLTVYRRPSYTQDVLNALLNCHGIEGVPIYISHDWNREYNAACAEVARIAKDFQRKHRGPSQYFVNRERLGIDLNKLFIIPKAFEAGADFVIFIEDDTVPARDFVRFTMAMAERYKDDKEIWSICGYNNISREELEAASPLSYGFSRGFNPWGWSTWRDRWEEFYGDSGEQYKSDTKHEANGLFDHWLSKKQRKFVLPIIPRIRLIGEFNAVHTTEADWEREQNRYGAWDLLLSDDMEYKLTDDTSMIHAGDVALCNTENKV